MSLVEMKKYEYLDKEKLKGFDNYKYNSVDTSPISVYISHPFWNWLVQFYPRWLAPNVLTFGGWALVMGCFLLQSLIDYNIDSNSVDSKSAPIPSWFWLLASICTFAAHTMDGTDGKQARRIGASGPTGELFDHGLDSWSTVPFTITIFSVFGQGVFSVSPVRLLMILQSVQTVFIVTHWEKYNTGVLFLSWGYDASQYGLAIVYAFTFVVGFEWYKFYVFGGFTFADCFEIGFYLCCIGSLIMSFWNMWDAHKAGTLQQHSVIEIVRPIISTIFLYVISLIWAEYSPNDVISRDPRMFFFTMGTVFSNIASRLIISQMSSTRAELWNHLVALYSLSAFLSIYVIPSYEMFILYSMSLIVLLAHVHYGVCVVAQMCDHFKIDAFDVKYLNKRNK
ncbi:ept-1 [Pristionchus pacificus]|nr:ept-1 [Pristionchus pacificus]